MVLKGSVLKLLGFWGIREQDEFNEVALCYHFKDLLNDNK